MTGGGGAFRGVAFDAFGTLFDLRGLKPRLAARFGSERAEEVFAGFTSRLVPSSWHLTASGRYRPLPEIAANAFAAAARGAGEALVPEEAAELAGELVALPAHDDVAPGLERLDDRRLAVLSNGTREGVAKLVEGAGLTDRFEHLLSVDEVGRYKPAPEAYSIAATAFAARPSEVVLVSAHEWDVAGAQAAGLCGALVAREGEVTGFLGHEPDFVIGDLGELAGALDRFERGLARE